MSEFEKIPPHIQQMIDSQYYTCGASIKSNLHPACRQDANFKDLYQESWIICIKKLVAGTIVPDPQRGLCGFLYKTAVNLCYQLQRKTKGVSEHNPVQHDSKEQEYDLEKDHQTEAGITILESSRKRLGLPHKSAVSEQDIDIIREILRPKDKKSQQEDECTVILILKYYYNFKTRDIAELMNLTENNVSVRILRCRQRTLETIKNNPNFKY